MKYALIKDNIVKVISYQPINGWEEVNDNVFADMIKQADGTFDYSDEVKAETQAFIDKQENRKIKRESAKSKLEALGLTTEEIKEAFGI